MIPLFLIYIVYMKLCKSSKNWKMVIQLYNYLVSMDYDHCLVIRVWKHTTLHLDQVFGLVFAFLSTWPTISVRDHFSDKIFKQDGATPHCEVSYCQRVTSKNTSLACNKVLTSTRIFYLLFFLWAKEEVTIRESLQPKTLQRSRT